MKVEYHPAVARDIAEALQRYDEVSATLGNELIKELRQLIAMAAARPGRFHPIRSEWLWCAITAAIRMMGWSERELRSRHFFSSSITQG